MWAIFLLLCKTVDIWHWVAPVSSSISNHSEISDTSSHFELISASDLGEMTHRLTSSTCQLDLISTRFQQKAFQTLIDRYSLYHQTIKCNSESPPDKKKILFLPKSLKSLPPHLKSNMYDNLGMCWKMINEVFVSNIVKTAPIEDSNDLLLDTIFIFQILCSALVCVDHDTTYMLLASRTKSCPFSIPIFFFPAISLEFLPG